MDWNTQEERTGGWILMSRSGRRKYKRLASQQNVWGKDVGSENT